MVRLNDYHHMTIAVDLDVKHQNKGSEDTVPFTGKYPNRMCCLYFATVGGMQHNDIKFEFFFVVFKQTIVQKKCIILIKWKIM